MTPPGSYRRGDDMQILANPETTKNLIIKKHEIKNLKKFMRPIENTRISKRRINKGFLPPVPNRDTFLFLVGGFVTLRQSLYLTPLRFSISL